MRNAARLAAFVLMVVVAACGKPPDSLQVEQNAIALLNQTDHDWKNVLIVVNDHYRGGAPSLKAGGRLNAPISQFDTGFGQRWPAHERIRKVVATATAANGEAIKFEWDINTAKPPRR